MIGTQPSFPQPSSARSELPLTVPPARLPLERVRQVVSPVRTGYVLLETVLATGLLIAGLAVIGAQLQDGHEAVRAMKLRLRALTLAEMQLAELDLGLIELDTVDEVQEEDFGPRYPDWAWRITIEDTAVETMYLMTLDVLFAPRDDYDEEFDFDNADTIHTAYAVRAAPQPLNIAADFGLTESQAEKLGEKLAELGLEVDAFDYKALGKLPSDEMFELLPAFLEAIGMPIDQLLSTLPPELRRVIEEAGLLGGGETGDEGSREGDNVSNQGEDEDVDE